MDGLLVLYLCHLVMGPQLLENLSPGVLFFCSVKAISIMPVHPICHKGPASICGLIFLALGDHLSL